MNPAVPRATLRTTIRNVRVFTGTGLTGPTEVAFSPDTGIGLDAATTTSTGDVVDGTGMVVIPGLIDTHVHTARGRHDLAALAGWGVTTALDMALWPQPYVQYLRDQHDLADFRSATVPAAGDGSRHAALPGFPADGIVTTPHQARAFVARRTADGADYIKIVLEAASDAGMDGATVHALVDAAHEHGKLVVAHAVTVGAYHLAIATGVDVITHAPLDGVLDDAAVERLRETALAVSPTLVMMAGTARQRPGLAYTNARDTVTRLHRAGIRILAGTDSNTAPGVPWSPPHGESLHQELQLLVEAGLSPEEALSGATSLAAATFGLADRGTLRPGHRADLLLLGGDPTADITATRKIHRIWTGGRPAEILATP